MLTATNNLTDADGLGSVSYQWFANDVAIDGAIGDSYTLTQDQVGKAIKVRASYTDGGGTVESKTSAVTSVVANLNDLPSGSVTISGEAKQGQTLRASNNLSDLDGLGTISYQWLANDIAIDGAIGESYTLTQDQVGKAIKVRASYTDGGGTVESKTSTATSVVANLNDLPSGSVTISGTATQGQMLTASNDLSDADGLGTISYQWLANDVAIDGATGDSYRLTQDQVGKLISVRASYTDVGGTTELVSSLVTAAVVDVNDAPTAVTLTSVLPNAKLAQNTPNTERIKLADVAVTDDSLGTNTFSLEGADSASFEVDATGLYLKANAGLNAALKTTYAVTVKVNDAGLPDASPVSSAFSLTVTPPVPMPSFRLLSDAGQSNLDGLSTQGTVLVADVAAGNTWQFSIDGGVTWQDGTGDRFELPEGDCAIDSIQVRQIDAATGNFGPVAKNSKLPDALLLSLNVNGEIFAFWDKSGDKKVGASGSPDTSNLTELATTLGITGAVSDTNRTGLLDGKLLAIPTLGNASLPTASAAVTLAPDSVLGTDGLAGLWDFVNGVGNTSRGVPAGWFSSNYVTVTKVGDSYVKLNLGSGEASVGNSGYVALQVRTPSAVSIDKTAPVVSSVTVDNASGEAGPWAAGEVVRVSVALSEVVYVSGLPKLTLRIGSQDVDAFYVSGSGTKTLQFEIALPTGLADLDGISIAADALKNWGGDIQDKAGTSANLALPAVDNNLSWTVDSRVPDAPVLRLLSDTGESNVDGVTSNGTVKVSGLLADGRWEYSTNAGTNWQTGSGDQWVLPAGTYAAGQIQARQYDASGRVSAVQTAFERAPLNLSMDRISDDDAVQWTQATTISGHAAAHAHVALSWGSLSTEVQADETGRWQWDLSADQLQLVGQGVQSVLANVEGWSVHRDVWVTGAMPNRINEWAGDELRVRFYTSASIDSLISKYATELQSMDGVGPRYGGTIGLSDQSWRTLAQKGLSLPFLFQFSGDVRTGGSMADGSVTDAFLAKLYDQIYTQVESVLTNPLKNSVVSNWYAYEEARDFRTADLRSANTVLKAIRDAEEAYGAPARPFEQYQPNHVEIARLDAFDGVFDVIEKGAYVQVGDSTIYTKILEASRMLVQASRSDTSATSKNTGAVGTEFTPQLSLAAYDPMSGVDAAQYQSGLRVGYYLALSQGIQGLNIWSYETRAATFKTDGSLKEAGLTNSSPNLWRDELFKTYASLGKELNAYEPELGKAIARGLWMDPAASTGKPVSFSAVSGTVEGGSFFINGSQYLILVNTSAADSASVQLTRNDADYTLWQEVLKSATSGVLSDGTKGSWANLGATQELQLAANSVRIIRVTDPTGLGVADGLPLVVEDTNAAPQFINLPTGTQQVVAGVATDLRDVGVADADGDDVPLTLTLSASNGTLTGLTDADAGAPGVQLRGTASQISDALALVRYTADAAGGADVVLSLSDGRVTTSSTYRVQALNASSGLALSVALANDTFATGIDGLPVRADDGRDGITRGHAWALHGKADPALGVVTILDGETVLGTATPQAGTGVWSFSASTLTVAGTSRADGSYRQISDPAVLASLGTSGVLAANFGGATLDKSRAIYKATLSGQDWYVWASVQGGYRITGVWDASQWYAASAVDASAANPDDVTAWTLRTSNTASGGASVTLTLSASHSFAEGEHAITVTQKTADDPVYAHQSLTLTRDSTPDQPPHIQQALTDDGELSSAGRTRDRSVVLNGTAPADVIVRVHDGATFIGQTRADASGHWALAPADFSARTHTLRATSVDAAGNESAAGADFELTVEGSNITGISSAQDRSHAYVQGDKVQIVLWLDDAITLNGLSWSTRPSIQLEIGGQTRTAHLFGVDPNLARHSLAFEYTLSASDVDADGVRVVADSLALNGSTPVLVSQGQTANLQLQGSWLDDFIDASADGAQRAAFGPTAVEPTVGVALTSDHGNAYLNGMLGPAKWGVPANGTLTYYLVTGYDRGYGTRPVEWTDEARAALRATFQNVTDVTGIQFREVHNQAQANFVETLVPSSVSPTAAMQSSLGVGNGQSTGFYSESRGITTALSSLRTLADVSGPSGYAVLVHELGHGLGLKHPFDTSEGDAFPGITASNPSQAHFGLNNLAYSVESYTSQLLLDELGLVIWSVNQTSFAAFDIAALQQMYGRNMSTRTGDDVYLLTDASLTSVWDAGGHDTFSAAAATKGAVIDLRAATLRAEVGGGGYISTVRDAAREFRVGGQLKTYDQSLNPVTIAHGVVIESAIGSAHDDRITGNTADNTLTGGAGNDRFVWVAGDAGRDGVTDFSFEPTATGFVGDRLDVSGLLQAVTGVAAGGEVDLTAHLALTSTGAAGADALLTVRRADGTAVQDIVLSDAWDRLAGLGITQLHDLGVLVTGLVHVPAVIEPIDTALPDWLTDAAYAVDVTGLSVLHPSMGMASLISNDAIGSGLHPAQTQASWLPMNSGNTTRSTASSASPALQLSYAFQGPGARYKDNEGVEHAVQAGMAYTDGEKDFVRSVFANFASFTNVQFSEIASQAYATGGGGGADLRLFKGTADEYGVDANVMGFAVQPAQLDARRVEACGDFFLVTDSSAYPAQNAFGFAYGSEKTTVSHELGHAMGLDHPFANSAVSPFGWYGDTRADVVAANQLGVVTGGSYDTPLTDTPQETLMTYHSPFTLIRGVSHSLIAEQCEVYTPWKAGVHDIAALQHLYGANMSHHDGPTTYRYDSDTPVFDTIWDAKGQDTLQQVGNEPAVIDLRGGEHMSRMGLFSDAKYVFSQAVMEADATSSIRAAYPGWTARVADLRAVYTDESGEHAVGRLSSTAVDGDTRWTYLTDPTMPAGSAVELKATFHFLEEGTAVAGAPATLARLSGIGVPDPSMAFNVGIAFGVVIENAIGGEGKDLVWGNEAANRITLGGGADTLAYDRVAAIRGDVVTDFGSEDRLDLTALGPLDRSLLDWDATTRTLQFTGAEQAWALTLQGSGVFQLGQVLTG
ncbi:M10 family metallopeptidase C-terminal domain-containing protein [Sphaerotilus mobilis]|nr:M10 family metallopeptidase C-terminal domain-containing protein [Sphaerotilus mobilis]